MVSIYLTLFEFIDFINHHYSIYVVVNSYEWKASSMICTASS